MLDINKPVRHSFSKGPAKILEVQEDGYVWYTYKDVVVPKDFPGHRKWVEPFLTHRTKLPLENVPEKRTLNLYRQPETDYICASPPNTEEDVDCAREFDFIKKITVEV